MGRLISVWVNVLQVFLLCTFVLLLGCQGADPGLSFTNADFRQGTVGLNMEFIRNSPPDVVFENEVFVVAAEIHNIGAADIADGYLLLRTEQDLLSVDGAVGSPFSLEGRSVRNPYGDSEIIEYTVHTKPITLSRLQETSLSLHSCYTYQTVAQETICVDPRIRDIGIAPSSCSAEDLSLSSQGAPVAVTGVQLRPILGNSGKKLQLRIAIAQLGEGFVTLPVPAEHLCTSGELSDEIFNRVLLSGALGDVTLECKREGVAILHDGVGDFICEVDNPAGETAYTTPLRLELHYSYTQSVAHSIDIERLR